MNKTFITFAAWATLACLPLQAAVEPAWDILDKDMTTWNADDGAETNRAWKTTKSYIAAEQAEGYVHLSKTGGADGFITPTACPATPKDTYTLDIRLRVNAPTLPDSDEGFEANQITAAVAGKKMKEIFDSMKNIRLLEETAVIRSSMKENQMEQVDALAKAIVESM